MSAPRYENVRILTEKAMQFNFSVSSGKIYSDGFSVSKSAGCPAEDKSISFHTWYSVDSSSKSLIAADSISKHDASVVVDEYYSSKQLRIRVRHGEGENGFVFDIFRGPRLSSKRILKGKHGSIATAPEFSAKPLSLHSTLPRVVYLAEILPAKADLFTLKYDSKNLAGNEYRHNYGEGLSDVYYFGIFMYDFEKQKVYRLKGLPADVSATSVTYLPGDEEELLVTFLDDKHKLLPALSKSFNKESKIYILSDLEFEDLTPDESERQMIEEKKAKDKEAGVKEEPAKLTKKLISRYPLVMFPSASPSGNKIAYFYRDTWCETHSFNTGLAVYDIETGETTEVVPCTETSNENRSIYANYDAHSRFVWTSDTEVVFPCIDLGRCMLNFLDLQTNSRRLVHLHSDFETDSIGILDTTNDRLLVALHNHHYSGRVGVVENWQKWRTADPAPEDFLWETNTDTGLPAKPHVLQPGSVAEAKVSIGDATGYVWYLKDYTDAHGVVVPLSKRPLLIDSHGGPHTYSRANYSAFRFVLLKMGWQVMVLNYSGSWSFGAEFNQRLCGQIGMIDVQEILNWLDSYRGHYDENNLVFHGGSYSGLQAMVLYREHHIRFRAVIATNPVLNLIGMLYQTDVPDWTSVEGLGNFGKFDIGNDLTDIQLLKLRDLSPALLPFDPETKTKLLLLLGDSDRTVPTSGSLFLYRKLKALGLDVRYLSYKGQGHVIRRPSHILDTYLNIFALIFGFAAPS